MLWPIMEMISGAYGPTMPLIRSFELIYRRTDVDSGGPLFHSNRLAHRDDVVGVRWCKDKCHREFLTLRTSSLRNRELFPDAFDA